MNHIILYLNLNFLSTQSTNNMAPVGDGVGVCPSASAVTGLRVRHHFLPPLPLPLPLLLPPPRPDGYSSSVEVSLDVPSSHSPT